jgi:hypothetical protein
MSEIEDLRKRVTELEKAAEPPKPFVPTPMPRRDLTEGMSMDRETMLAHARAVGGVMPEDRLDFQYLTTIPITSSRTSTPSRFWLGRAPATRKSTGRCPRRQARRCAGSDRQNRTRNEVGEDRGRIEGGEETE